MRWKSAQFLFRTTSRTFPRTSAAQPISSVSSAFSSERGKNIKVSGNKFERIKEISQAYNCKEGFVHDEYFNIMKSPARVPFQKCADKKKVHTEHLRLMRLSNHQEQLG